MANNVLARACLVLFLLATPCFAETVPDLYSAEVYVPDQRQSSLVPASREALAEVLVKVSGSPRVLENPEIQAALAKARGKVQQYSYRRDPDSDSGLSARFEFDRQQVTDLVTGAGEPLWTANRPGVLAWFVLGSGEDAVFLGSDAAPQQADALLRAFARRGVPVRLPLFDLADTAALSAADVLALDGGKLREASARYDVEHIVAGRINVLSTGEVVGEWSYFYDGDRLDRQVSAADFNAHMQTGVDLVATAMASLYAVAAVDDGSGGVPMSVSGVGSYGDYAAVVAWLESLELIEAVRVERVVGERLELRLDSRAERTQLPSLIELNPRLERSMTPGDGGRLSYRWMMPGEQ